MPGGAAGLLCFRHRSRRQRILFLPPTEIALLRVPILNLCNTTTAADCVIMNALVIKLENGYIDSERNLIDLCEKKHKTCK